MALILEIDQYRIGLEKTLALDGQNDLPGLQRAMPPKHALNDILGARGFRGPCRRSTR